MSFALGWIVRNEHAMLKLTLPFAVFTTYPMLALDTGSTDGTQDLLRSHGVTVSEASWVDYSHARNSLLSLARLHGHDWLLMLDADEAMWTDDIHRVAVRTSTTRRDLISLPRFNLADAGRLQETGSWPDRQPRCIRLSAPIEFKNSVHEVACYTNRILGITSERQDEYSASTPIYHYGWCKPPAANWLRSHNYERIQRGDTTIDTVPEGIISITYADWLADMRTRHTFAPFTQPHPLQDRL